MGDGHDPRECPSCHAGKLSLKTSRFGAFVGCSNYPECRFTRKIATGGDDPYDALVAAYADQTWATVAEATRVRTAIGPNRAPGR